MRIFLSCQHSPYNYPIPSYQFWSVYFKKGIEESGHNWIDDRQLDWAKGLTYTKDSTEIKKWRADIWNLTIDSIKKQTKKQNIDLFLSYLYPQQIEPQAIKEIQNLGIPCVNFFCDNVREFTKVPKEFKPFNLHWVPEYKALKMYREAKLNYIHRPMPVWIDFKYRTSHNPEKYNTTFIGSQDIQRSALLSQVIKLGVDLEIRGYGWNNKHSIENNITESTIDRSFKKTINQINFIKTQGISPYLRKIQSKFQKPIDRSIFIPYIKNQPQSAEYIQIIQQSIITLGINRYPSFRYPFHRPDTYSRMRDIEAPMMGACYLTEWTEGLDLLYELEKEIETYRNPQEMKDKIKKLQKDNLKRSQLRYWGQKKALEKLSVPETLKAITNKLNI